MCSVRNIQRSHGFLAFQDELDWFHFAGKTNAELIGLKMPENQAKSIENLNLQLKYHPRKQPEPDCKGLHVNLRAGAAAASCASISIGASVSSTASKGNCWSCVAVIGFRVAMPLSKNALVYRCLSARASKDCPSREYSTSTRIKS